jgi:hypothetical protein
MLAVVDPFASRTQIGCDRPDPANVSLTHPSVRPDAVLRTAAN